MNERNQLKRYKIQVNWSQPSSSNCYFYLCKAGSSFKQNGKSAKMPQGKWWLRTKVPSGWSFHSVDLKIQSQAGSEEVASIHWFPSQTSTIQSPEIAAILEVFLIAWKCSMWQSLGILELTSYKMMKDSSLRCWLLIIDSKKCIFWLSSSFSFIHCDIREELEWGWQ